MIGWLGWFIGGVFVGGAVGIFAAAIFVAGNNNDWDDDEEWY